MITMPNVTFAMDEKLLEKSREYAKRNGMSHGEFIRSLIADTVEPKNRSLDDFWELADAAGGNSKGQKWSREDAYDAKRIGLE